ncbi:MAG: hypothetical protein QM831_11095 [Kofleriaceae bacterium]
MVRVVVLVLLAARIVAAQEADPPGQTPGAKLFEEGRDLAKANKFAEACAKFEQSYALDNGVGTELNLADCHEHLGHMALAYRLFDEAAQRLANEPARAKFAHDRAMALTAKLATVVVNLAEPELPGLSVTIGGRAVKARSVITEKSDPGAIAVHVATPSKTIFDGTKNAEAGATAIFTVGEVTTSGGDVGPGPGAGGDQQPEHSGSKKKLVSFTLVGVGGAAVITSVIVGVIARGNYNDATGPSSGCIKTGDMLQCPADATKKADDAGSLADTATYIGIAGAAFVAAGVITYFAWPKEDLVVAPSVTNQSAGLAISGRF